jgi:hypothetical protein
MAAFEHHCDCRVDTAGNDKAVAVRPCGRVEAVVGIGNRVVGAEDRTVAGPFRSLWILEAWEAWESYGG